MVYNQDRGAPDNNKNIDVVILCGGKGTRMYPLTADIPKPMVPIGEKPVLEHIIRNYQKCGFKNFKLCVGHKKEHIINHFENLDPDLNLQCIDTGEETNTAERLWKVKDVISDDFFLNYADVLHNANFADMYDAFKQRKKMAAMLVIPLRTAYGIMHLDDDNYSFNYEEKPTFFNMWTNAGSLLFNKEIFRHWDLVDSDFSRGMITKLAKMNEFYGYKHTGFWSGMDTVKENELLNGMWADKKARWADIINLT
ncbi:NDP-sugar synthase [Patescibacteria group bacterium]